jgi:hypothetical protein
VAQPVGWIVTEEAPERPGLLPVLSTRPAVRATPPTRRKEGGMSTIADDDRRVIAGVDTHKEFCVVVVLDELGRRLDP